MIGSGNPSAVNPYTHMTQQLHSHKRYSSDFLIFQENLSSAGSGWVNELRVKAMESFEKVNFPTATRGNEKWKYTNISPIANTSFMYPFDATPHHITTQELKQSVPWDDSWLRLVFVDGHYSHELSEVDPAKKNIYVTPLSTALKKDAAIVKQHLGQHAPIEEDGFAAVNMAFVQDGTFVHIPPNRTNLPPINLVFVTTKRDQPTVSHPRNLILVGEHSNATIIESYLGISRSPYFTNAVTEMVTEKGAQIEHYKYVEENPESFHLDMTRVNVGENGVFNSTSLASGARIARSDLKVVLNAPGASCNLKGLYFTSGRQHIDNHINIDHVKGHTNSQQYFKGILMEESKAVFSGRVLIMKDAQKSTAQQSDKNLLLSSGARINTKPSLEIFADDVQATHGATAGAIAEEAIFYMKSRGIDEDTSKILLINGFASEIIDTVKLEPIRNQMYRLLSGTANTKRATTLA